jgi:hypothetical protein
MPTSDITSMAMRQEWFVGDVRTYQSPVTTSTANFSLSITLDPVIPHVERVNFYAQPTAVDGTDENGIYYGGVYKPNTNDIVITGSTLSAAQRQIIRNSLSYNINPQAGGEDRFGINIGPVAAAGAQFFSIVVPYEETIIVNSSPTIEIPFITVTGDGTAADPTTVIVDRPNRKIIIDAGFDVTEFPSLRTENIANGRIFNSFVCTKSAGNFRVDWDEDISNRPLLVLDNNFDIQPIQIGAYKYGMNYRYRVQTVSGNIVINIGRQVGRVSLNSSLFELIPDLIAFETGRGISGTATLTSNSNLQMSFICSGTTNDRVFNLLQIRNRNLAALSAITCQFTATSITLSSIGLLAGGGLGPVSYTQTFSASAKVSTALAALRTICASLSLYHGVNTDILVANEAAFDTANWSDIDFATIVIPYPGNGGSLGDPLTYTSPLLAIPRVTNIDLTQHTLSSLLDAISLSFDGFPCLATIPYTVLSTAWVDMPAIVLTNNVYVIGATAPPGLMPTTTIYAGGEFYTDTSDYTWANFPTFTALASTIQQDFQDQNITCTAGLYHSSLEPASYLIDGYDSGTVNSLVDTPSFVSVPPSVSNWTSFYNVVLDGTVTIADLISDLNTNMSGMLFATLLDPNYAVSDANELTNQGPDSILTIGSQAVFNVSFQTRILREYPFATFPTLSGLVSSINSFWTSRGVTAAVYSQTQSYPTESITSNLLDNTASGGVNVFDTTEYLGGTVHSVSTPSAPVEDVTYSFNVRFAVGGNQNDLAGIQVALGGYESGGVFFLNDSPNSFFEPGFNSLFPIEFNVLNADTIYLLVRSRQNLEGTIFTSTEADYAGVARFSNGFPSQTLLPSIPTDPRFTGVWTETNLGDPPSNQVPVVLAITGASPFINVLIDELHIPDSIYVTINNVPDVLDEFAFLAINRSNLNGSMTESRNGRVFGMVLDNRGIWDVLIGPESEIAKVLSGNFNHLGSSYARTPQDADEAYDFVFNNLSVLPSLVQSAISLIPVPGYPQVWILRIERGVKQYLASLRENVNKNSQDGCSIDIDMLVTGRSSEVQGICRVTVFYDVYCVFDVALCDAFWNLVDPPEPSGPPVIEDQLLFTYESLIDCDRLEVNAGGANTEISVPILLNIRNVPTFENGNALLLIKSFYTAEIQGFYFPVGEDLSNIVFEDCTTVGSNLPLFSTLNKSLFYLPGQTNPITDPIQIQSLITTEQSYLYVEVAFQFPSTDSRKDCGQDEVIIAALGYQFRNWTSGLREDNILFGVDMVIPGGVYVAPELQICYRYYYDQEES